ncbi:MAG: FAD-binding oxidoreductase [Rhabdochlamydiaceae bacterium]|nr:FAD-binding oxidoreductase [Rhabdochlamydiaceae bacterium]
MKVAVVGAGFSGLALSFHFLEKGAQVHLYDQKGIGAGASGVSSGLLHPYAGEQVRRSWKADEAMEATKSLLEIAQKFSAQPVADFSGILRKVDPKQRETFLKHAALYKDVEILNEEWVLIRSGIAVHSSSYLAGLYEACTLKGLVFFQQKIDVSAQLSGYDACVFALGAGIFSFAERDSGPLSQVRGQTLLCKWNLPPLQYPLLGKGHVVPLPGGKLVHVGATYERNSAEIEPCEKTAMSLLKPQMERLVPDWKDMSPIDCRAGIRVVRPGHATAWMYPIGDKKWVLTAMGSRGLLYHAYYAKAVIENIGI